MIHYSSVNFNMHFCFASAATAFNFCCIDNCLSNHSADRKVKQNNFKNNFSFLQQLNKIIEPKQCACYKQVRRQFKI